MTLEEIQNKYAYEAGFADWNVLVSYGEDMYKHIDEVAQRYAQSQTQELIEQNKELVANIQLLLQSLDYDALGVMSGLIIEDLKELLTKYNHLKSNTNETDKI